MTNFSDLLKNKKPDFNKLIENGFVHDKKCYSRAFALDGCGLVLTVTVTESGKLNAEVKDPATGEPYVLHLVDGAEGSFVGSVRSACEDVFNFLAENCYHPDRYNFSQTKRLIAYASKTFAASPEFLWKEYSGYSVLRRGDTDKWFAVLMKIKPKSLTPPPARSILTDENGFTEVADFRMAAADLEVAADGLKYFRGYHMNKKSWCTIVLDDALSDEEVFTRLSESFSLAVKK